MLLQFFIYYLRLYFTAADLQGNFIDSESDKDQEAPLADREAPLKHHHHSQHRMHLLRFDLMQFVNGLHQYIMTRVGA